MEGEKELRLALVTANVGSIFENPDQLFEGWISQFVKAVTSCPADLIALHCQEMGGKNYEKCFVHVDSFVERLSQALVKDFPIAIAFIDKDFKSNELFTALANVYFVHKSVTNVAKIWNFNNRKFERPESKVYSDNISLCPLAQKQKFPLEISPMLRLSRKGFLRTRWQVRDGTPFELVNIHLFHDESNFIASKEFPSPYTLSRQTAIHHTLERVSSPAKDDDDLRPKCSSEVPFFIFGDFNFRLDTRGAVERLTGEGSSCSERTDKDGKVTRKEFKEGDKRLLTLEKKKFDLHDNHLLFTSDLKRSQLRDLDKEPLLLQDTLFELDVKFPPSYPYSEDAGNGRDFLGTRCPSWCDRILFNSKANQVVVREGAKYQLIGPDICMGDHKPVYLHIKLNCESMDDKKPENGPSHNGKKSCPGGMQMEEDVTVEIKSSDCHRNGCNTCCCCCPPTRLCTLL